MSLVRHLAPLLLASALIGAVIGVLQELGEWGPWELAGAVAVGTLIGLLFFFWVEDHRTRNKGPLARNRTRGHHGATG